DILRVRYLRVRMDTYLSARRSADVLAAGREAALVLARLLSRPSLHPNARWHVAANCLPVSLLLRRAKAYEEAIQLSQQANRALQELCLEAPNQQQILRVLSESWHEIGQIRWDLQQTEETLTAYRNALEAQQKLYSLAPAVDYYRRI